MRATICGRPVTARQDGPVTTWIYEDGTICAVAIRGSDEGIGPVDDTFDYCHTVKPCPVCDKKPLASGADPFLGDLPGVSSACCGHGLKPPKVVIDVEADGGSDVGGEPKQDVQHQVEQDVSQDVQIARTQGTRRRKS